VFTETQQQHWTHGNSFGTGEIQRLTQLADEIASEIRKNQFKSYDTMDHYLTAKYLFLEQHIANILGDKFAFFGLKLFAFIAPVYFRNLIQHPKNADTQVYARYLTFLIERNKHRPEYQQSDFEEILNTIEKRAIKAANGVGWGFMAPIDVETLIVDPGVPVLHSTIMVLNAILAFTEVAGHNERQDVLISGCRHIALDYVRTSISPGCQAISYTTKDSTCIINVSAEAASLLARVAQHTGDESHIDLARSLIKFTLCMQEKDGSWPYSNRAPAADLHHTAMVLISLIDIANLELFRNSTTEVALAINDGVRYFLNEFFDRRGIATIIPGKKIWSSYSIPYAIDCLIRVCRSEHVSPDLRRRCQLILPKVVYEGVRAFQIRGESHVVERRVLIPCRMSAFRIGFAHFSSSLVTAASVLDQMNAKSDLLCRPS
jgi:hypothetical protein